MYATLRTIGAIAVITAVSLTSPAIVRGGKLSVGSKVLYPGGADQPPREKDTGVTLNADVLANTADNQNVQFESGILTNESIDKLEAAGEYEEMLLLLANRTDPVAMAYKAIALEKTGEFEDGETIAIDLLKGGQLPRVLQHKLARQFALEDFVENDKDEN